MTTIDLNTKCDNGLYSFAQMLENSFLDYRGRLIQTLDRLPAHGQLKEIALRVIAIVAAPILYPSLCLAYLTGQLLKSVALGSKSAELSQQSSFTASKSAELSQQIAALKKAGLPGWQQQAMTLVRKSRYDDPDSELQRLRDRGVLTNKVESRLNKSIYAIDPAISNTKRDQVKVIMAQALEIKGIYGDTHHVLIHAQKTMMVGLSILVKELHRTFEPNNNNIKNFKFLRPPCKLAKPGMPSAMWQAFRNTFLGEPKITNVRDYIESKWFVCDSDRETHENLLSVDAYFFNPQKYESSLFFLTTNSNIAGNTDTLKSFYKQIISHYRPNMNDRDLGRLAGKVVRATQLQGDFCGNLFTICVPKKMSEDVQYRAHPFGTTCTCHPKEDNLAIISKLQEGGPFDENTKCLGNFPIPQYRLYTPLLKPDVTPIYLLTPFEKTVKKSMKFKIQRVVHEIAQFK